MGLVLGGVFIGTAASGIALFAGYSIWLVLLAYSLGGILGVFVLASSLSWREDEDATNIMPDRLFLLDSDSAN